ncbi:MAG: hypothetical protein GF313_05175, partial [Caldithrix sp.]|nr:hypothetical protein [Caldithrix sp.]
HSVHFGIVVFDASHSIHFINDAAMELLNIRGNKSRMDTLGNLLGSKEYDQFQKTIANKELPMVRQELRIKRATLPELLIGYSIYPFEYVKGRLEYILVFSEISQSKRLQEEIIRMDRMASLGILSSGIAHEIRNPLAGIKAMAQNLDDELGESGPQSEYVHRILKQVDRLDDLLKSFFSYAKPLRPEPKSCQIHKLMHDVLPLIQQKIKEKNITLKEDYHEGLHPIFVDANQIIQVFLNLFLNAIDALEPRGTLKITATNSSQITPMLTRQNKSQKLLSDRFIEIRIEDNGKGIPADVNDKIFDPFFTTKSNGTGLGLSIVYQIIREHGGYIDVNSKVNEGTTFSILLPVAEQSEKLSE